MALRVDNILISEKNVYLMDGDKKYVADIESVKAKDDENDGFSGNLWNIFDSEGTPINNLFDASSFNVRTQSLTTMTKGNPDDKDSHETFFMPKLSTTSKSCQLYDNAYTIGNLTDESFSSEFSSDRNGETSTYQAENGFCQYQPIDEIKASVTTSISPEIMYTPDIGVQYLTEYPINGFYSDFGDNTDANEPTIYGDAVLTKYFLDNNYSVNATVDANGTISFKKMRSYSDIGTTGNSVYLVYKNDMIGSNKNYKVIHGENFVNDKTFVNPENFKADFNIDTLGFMGNLVTVVSASDNRLYSANSFDSTFEVVDAITSTLTKEFQPSDSSFELYYIKGGSDGKVNGLQYIPKNGTFSSSFALSFASFGSANYENESDITVAETNQSVIVATKNHGLILVRGISFEDGLESSTKIEPFTQVALYSPDGTSKPSTSYRDFKVFYNGSDILGVTCKEGTESNAATLAFFSVEQSDSKTGEKFVIGQKWHIAIATDNEYVHLKSDVVAAASVKSDILFDYCPTDTDGVHVGSYAFVQFANLGLRKAYVTDLAKSYAIKYKETTEATSVTTVNDVYTVFSSTGVINKVNGTTAVCTGVHFDISSYSESLKTSALYEIDYRGSSNSFVKVKPSLKAVWKSSSGYSESFAVFPLTTDRSVVTEPSVSTTSDIAVEQFPISNHKFALDVNVPYSKAVTVRNLNCNNSKHDVSAALVKWNVEGGTYQTNLSYENPETSLGGLHLQYSALVTDVFVQGTYGLLKKWFNLDWNFNIKGYNASVYEYPHPAYGDFVTEGTGLKIFDGELADSMKVKDILFVNNNLVVKNYKTKPRSGTGTSSSEKTEIKSEKSMMDIVPEYPSGGYVVSNYFGSETNKIGTLYSSELVLKTKRDVRTDGVYDRTCYNNFWHMKPTKAIGFYPISNSKEQWKPYYSGKYVESIQYNNGYYYIVLRTSESMPSTGHGYELIETTSLYQEEATESLENGRYITGVKFLGKYVSVEYSKYNEAGAFVKDTTKVFEQGKFSTRNFLSVGYVENPRQIEKEKTWFVQNGLSTEIITDNVIYAIDSSTTSDSIQCIAEPYHTQFTEVQVIDGKLMCGLGKSSGIPSLHYNLVSDRFSASISPNDLSSRLSSLTKLGAESMISCDGVLTRGSVGNGIIICLKNAKPKHSRKILRASGSKTVFTDLEYGNYKVCASYSANGVNYCIVKNLTNPEFLISRGFPQYGNGYSCGEIFEPIDTGFEDDEFVECFKITRCVNGEKGKIIFTLNDNGVLKVHTLDESTICETVSGVSVPTSKAKCLDEEKSISGVPSGFSPVRVVQNSITANGEVFSMFLCSDNRIITLNNSMTSLKKTIDVGAVEVFLPGCDRDGVDCYGISVIVKNSGGAGYELNRIISDGRISTNPTETGIYSYEIHTNDDGTLVALSLFDIYGTNIISAVDFRNSYNSQESKYDYSASTSFCNFKNLKHTIVPTEGSQYTINFTVYDFDFTSSNFYLSMSSKVSTSASKFGVVKATSLTEITSERLAWELSNYSNSAVTIMATEGERNSIKYANILLTGSFTVAGGSNTVENGFISIKDNDESLKEVSISSIKSVTFILTNVRFTADTMQTELEVTKDNSADACANYDNVELLYSLNRFTPSVFHKSNLFSIRIEDLGLDESPYLTESQKDNIERWFKNRISDIVESVKPANTQLFDVYMR